MENSIKNWLTQIKKGYLDLCVLSLIEVKSQTYGFQLISELSSIDINIKEGTLYPLLNRMTRDGLLSSKWDTENLQGHPRKFYALTNQGQSNLQAMKKEYQSMYLTFEKIKNLGGENDERKTGSLSS